MQSLLDKVVMISGTGGGQGRAAALAFSKAGAKVIGTDVKGDAAEETVQMVTAAGGIMHSLHPLDISTEAGAHTWVSFAVERCGGIDVLYNNAGSLRAKGPFSDTTLEAWELTLRFELTLPFICSHAAWPHLIARGGGLIINTASMSGHREHQPLRTAAHGAAKAGVLGLTRMLAAEGAEYGIRAISISPGLIRSPATEAFWTSNDATQLRIGRGLLAKIPMARYGTCDEVADVAVFLASPQASYLNATDIAVDGGILGVAFDGKQ